MVQHVRPAQAHHHEEPAKTQQGVSLKESPFDVQTAHSPRLPSPLVTGKSPLQLISQWKASLPKGVSVVQQPGSFLEAPLRWNEPDAALARQGKLPLRLRKPLLWLQQNPKLSIGLGIVLLLVLITGLAFGIRQTLQAVNGSSTEFEQPIEDSMGLGVEDDGLGNAFLAVSQANKAVKHQGTPRTDPFKPLVKMDWYERILEMKRNAEQQQEDNAGTLVPPNYGGSNAGSQLPDAMPLVPNMPVASLPQAPTLDDALRYVGVIKDKSSGNKRTVLLQYKGSDGTRLISKAEGSTFMLDGVKIQLKRADAQGVDLIMNGKPKYLQGFKPSTSNTPKITGDAKHEVAYTPPSTKTQHDGEIDKILKELDAL
jgi:hypothetical protein